jgi:hypothetical protein
VDAPQPIETRCNSLKLGTERRDMKKTPKGADFLLKSLISKWLPFLDTYRTMCIAPSPDFLQALEGISALRVAA